MKRPQPLYQIVSDCIRVRFYRPNKAQPGHLLVTWERRQDNKLENWYPAASFPTEDLPKLMDLLGQAQAWLNLPEPERLRIARAARAAAKPVIEPSSAEATGQAADQAAATPADHAGEASDPTDDPSSQTADTAVETPPFTPTHAPDRHGNRTALAASETAEASPNQQRGPARRGAAAPRAASSRSKPRRAERTATQPKASVGRKSRTTGKKVVSAIAARKGPIRTR